MLAFESRTRAAHDGNQGGIWLRKNLHDDEDGDEDGYEARPRQPRDLLKLPHAGEYKHRRRRNQHERVGADSMVRQGVQTHRRPKDARGPHDGKCDEEEDADDLAQPGPADDVGHVGDGVATCVPVAEVALQDGAVGVEELPAEDVDGAGEGAEDVHGRGDGEDTGGEDYCVSAR